MAKKTKVALTIDRDILRRLDDYVRTRQKKELEKGAVISNRSKMVEEILRTFLRKRERGS